MHDAENLIAVCDQTGDFDDTSEYQLLIRLLKEQTILDDDGTRRLRTKEEKENPSEVLLNPSDPEATFRYKAGSKHLGYVGNVVESVGEEGSLITDYAYEQNTYADNQFMKDHLNKQPVYETETLLVADGAYSGHANTKQANEHNIKLVTTNFTGRKPKDVFAEFVFSADVKELLKCAHGQTPLDSHYEKHNDRCDVHFCKKTCEVCPYQEKCNPKFRESTAYLEISHKAVDRGKQLQFMKTEEFQKYAYFRNGVEAIPSLLRRRYHVDKIPVHGKKRTRFHFGFKIAALNFQKLLDYCNSLDSCVHQDMIA